MTCWSVFYQPLNICTLQRNDLVLLPSGVLCLSLPANGNLTSLTSLTYPLLCYRSKSLALHTVLAKTGSSDCGDDEQSAGIPGSVSLSEIDPLSPGSDKLPLRTDTHGAQLRNSSASHPSIVHIESGKVEETSKDNFQRETPEKTTNTVEYQDKLYLHLKENLSKVKAYAMELMKKIPIPDQCTIEGKCFQPPELEKAQMSLKNKNEAHK